MGQFQIHMESDIVRIELVERSLTFQYPTCSTRLLLLLLLLLVLIIIELGFALNCFAKVASLLNQQFYVFFICRYWSSNYQHIHMWSRKYLP